MLSSHVIFHTIKLVLGAAHVRKHLTCKPRGCSMLPSLHTIFSIYFHYVEFFIAIYVKANKQILLQY